MCLDRLLPNADVLTSQRVMVEAEPGEVYRALLQLDFTAVAERSPVVRALICLRELPHYANDLPNRFYRCLRGREAATPASPSYRLTDLGSYGTWVRLAEHPGEEFVFGLIGKFWQANYGALTINARDFTAFNCPGYAKTVCGFSVRPYGAGRSIVTYEVCTATTDASARRRFRWYWRLIGLGAAYLMHCALQALKAAAEEQVFRRQKTQAHHMQERTV